MPASIYLLLASGEGNQHTLVEELVKLGFSGAASLAHTATGAPTLCGAHGDWQVSVSHTRKRGARKVWAALAVSRLQVGIDIEPADGGQRALRVAERFLAQTELPMLEGNDVPHSWNKLSPEERALRLWTAKEAIFKLSTAPLPDFRRQIVLQHSDGDRLACHIEGTGRAIVYHQETTGAGITETAGTDEGRLLLCIATWDK